jgi:hypothetical protein
VAVSPRRQGAAVVVIRFANALASAASRRCSRCSRATWSSARRSYRERIDRCGARRRGRAGGGVLHQFVGDAVGELRRLEENVARPT